MTKTEKMEGKGNKAEEQEPAVKRVKMEQQPKKTGNDTNQGNGVDTRQKVNGTALIKPQ
jgi:hypothetical protein